MVNIVRGSWTYLLGGKEVAKKTNLTSNLRMVSIVRGSGENCTWKFDVPVTGEGVR